jgi:acetyl-CoA acetyltransferase
MTPSATLTMGAIAYMKKYGVTNVDCGHYVVSIRNYAATNPNAWYYERPITLEEHQQSKWIIEPYVRLLDCCQESDGGVAIVMTSVERAKNLRNAPIVVKGGAQEMHPKHNPGFASQSDQMAARLFKSAGLKPSYISCAYLYDAFTPHVFLQLEGLGFCGPGEAASFIRSGATAIDGALPMNTNGGLIGEAYIHGMNFITEAVRQLRGVAANQVKNVEHVLVSAGQTGHILGRL